MSLRVLFTRLTVRPRPRTLSAPFSARFFQIKSCSGVWKCARRVKQGRHFSRPACACRLRFENSGFRASRFQSQTGSLDYLVS